MTAPVIAFGSRATELPTRMTRAYLEAMMPALLEHLGEERTRHSLLTLASAPEQLFGTTSVEMQVMRTEEVITAYAGLMARPVEDGQDPARSVYLDIVRCDIDFMILAVTDLQDGECVIAPIPLHTAVEFAMAILQRVQEVTKLGEEAQ